jgi:putative transcriptional regulator
MMTPSMTSIKKGSLLIASFEIESDFFYRSVILICEHSPSGTFGLVLNKPLEAGLPQELLELDASANEQIAMRMGGPVQTNQLLLLHNSSSVDKAINICDHVYLGGDLEFLQTSLENQTGPSILLCFGYTGWGPDELEKDIANGFWFLSDAKHEYLFKTPPENLWKQALLDKGGKYSSLSLMPDDLSQN